MIATATNLMVTLFVLVMVLGIYFLPTLIAADRHVVNTGSVIVVNLLLGWTLVGWVVALAMALRTATTVAAKPPPA